MLIVVNLRTLYPRYYKQDYYVEIPKEVYDAMELHRKSEKALREKDRKHRAYYSLDRNIYTEYGVVHSSRTKSPQEIIEIIEDEMNEENLFKILDRTLKCLSQKQYNRIFDYYINGLTLRAIAEKENVSIASVDECIKGGLKKLQKEIRKIILKENKLYLLDYVINDSNKNDK